MSVVKNKSSIRNQSIKKSNSSESSTLNLTDENRFTLISKDPYFKKKAKEFGNLLSELDSGQNLI